MKPHNFPKDAVLLDLSPSPTKLPEPLLISAKCKSKTLPVRTEFVFAAHQPFSSVMLCGDWADWNPIPMTLEQQHVWSVITVVPSGYREFCYLADGTPVVSRKHPTNPQGTLNWRRVYGPPPRPRLISPNPLSRCLHQISNVLRLLVSATFDSDIFNNNNNNNNNNKRQQRARRRDDESFSQHDVETSFPPALPAAPAWHQRISLLFAFALVSLLVYAALFFAKVLRKAV